jgi:hypothetical protein
MIDLTFRDHLLNLCKVFQQSREGHLKLNLEKCQLLWNVQYFRHIVSHESHCRQEAESHRGMADPEE